MTVLREKAERLGVTRLFTRECSICNYHMSYFVRGGDYNQLFYDAGCDCVTYHGIYQEDWSSLDNLYNMQSDKGKAHFDGVWFSHAT